MLKDKRFVFGEFELDVAHYQLSRNGQAIRLERIPMNMLILLIEQADQVVSRETVLERLWGKEVSVDYEHGINTAVRKIRQSLQDDASNPRFVETVVGRGYRFKAPVVRKTDLPGSQPPARARLAVIATGIVALLAILAYFAGIGSRKGGLLHGVALTSDTASKDARIVTDGKRVFWTQFLDNGAAPYQVSTKGGDPSPIPTPFMVSGIVDISHDRSSLLLLVIDKDHGPFLGGELWSLPIAGGHPRRLGDMLVSDAVFSPNGSLLALARGDDIYLANSDGGRPRLLVHLPGRANGLHWSNAGDRLRFSVADSFDVNRPLWELRVADSKAEPILSDWGSKYFDRAGLWTPDGCCYIFASNSGASHGLFLIREKSFLPWLSHEPTALPAGPIDYRSPTMSPDGKQLFMIGFEQRGELLRWDASAKQFLPYLGGISAQMLDFARDGSKVVYSSFPDRQLWAANADGNNRTALHITGRDGQKLPAVFPRWSPDGSRIAFSGFEGHRWRVYVVGAGGGSASPVRNSEEEQQLAPGWSADGKSLVYSSFASRTASPATESSLKIVDLASGQAHVIPRSENLFNPRWSPDGSTIIATPSDTSGLLKYEVATERWSELMRGNADYPSWSADGSTILFEDSAGLETRFRRLHLKDGVVDTISTTGRVLRASDRVFGKWTGVSPDGSPVLLRNLGNEQVYAFDWSSPFP